MEDKTENGDEKVPLHPKETTSFVAVEQWKKDMNAWFLSKGLMGTARNGLRSVLPTQFYTAKASGSTVMNEALNSLHKEANGKVYSALLAATRKTAPTLYETLLTKTFFDAEDEDKDHGLGHLARDFLYGRLEEEDPAEIRKSVSDRKEFLDKPGLKRYCTVEEWDGYLTRFDTLNLACGSAKLQGPQHSS